MQSTESSVRSIIAAFASGLEVFKRLRRLRPGQQQQQQNGGAPRKAKGAGGKHSRPATQQKRDKSEGEELRLSKSLRQGSVEVQQTYETHLTRGGLRYANGDVAAHASLAQTLLKLNAGLVNIITSFLSHGKQDVPIDYRTLTSLSETSRIEALDALSQLYQRLSTPDLRSQQRLNSGQQASKAQRQPPSRKVKQESRKTERSADLPQGIAKVTVNTSQTHFALVRPVNKRKDSAVSTGSSRSRAPRSQSSSPSLVSACPPTPVTPPPAYQLPTNVELPPSFRQMTQQQQPRDLSSEQVQHWPPHYHQPAPVHEPQRQPLAQNAQYAQHTQQPSIHLQPVPRRRDKVTPSFHSFASDSTKLGEIPMHRWIVPFDFAEMERLNREALQRPSCAGTPTQQQTKGRSRLRKLFGKGGGGTS